MHEFTTGVLYPKMYEAEVLQALPQCRQPYFHRNVNSRWNAFFLEDEWLELAGTVQFLLRLSARPVPLLWFHDSDDYGWGFRLFDNGAETAAATIPYALDVELTEAEYLRKHPEVATAEEIVEHDGWREIYEELMEMVVQSEQYRKELTKGIARFRPHSFARLLTGKQVDQLRSLFDPEFLLDLEEGVGSSLLYDSVDLFKEILGMEEMKWVNYAYLASGGME